MVSSPDYFRALGKLIEELSLEHWKAYLRWHMVHGAAAYMNRAIVEENFNFTRNLTGAKELAPRSRR